MGIFVVFCSFWFSVILRVRLRECWWVGTTWECLGKVALSRMSQGCEILGHTNLNLEALQPEGVLKSQCQALPSSTPFAIMHMWMKCTYLWAALSWKLTFGGHQCDSSNEKQKYCPGGFWRKWIGKLLFVYSDHAKDNFKSWNSKDV